MKKFTRPLVLLLAIAAGLVAFSTTAPAQSSGTVICYRGRTITVTNSVLPRYFAAGAEPGPCTNS